MGAAPKYPAAIPTLDEIAMQPECLRGLAPKILGALIAKCSAVQAVLAAEVLVLNAAEQNDHLLNVEEASRILAVTTDWLYGQGKMLGLTVKIGDGTLRFSSAAIQKMIAENRISAIPARRRKSRLRSRPEYLTNKLS